MSATFGNLYPGLADGPINNDATSVINAIVGDDFLIIGEVVRVLRLGTTDGFTRASDLLPRVGIPSSAGDPAYGVVVGGNKKGTYHEGIEPTDEENASQLGILAGLITDGVKVCTKGMCLAEIVNRAGIPLNIGDPLTSDRGGGVFGAFKLATSGDFVLARLLQPIDSGTAPSPAQRIAAVDVQREGILP